MGDRDIPSVPVTTLAGLTSPSDLLSELPVSNALNNTDLLNKSLLFHTLVANESNNLLSIRDENLVRQLVSAIEQTDSENIELKSEYMIHHHGSNISTFPELLQGIYNFRPTVFNTPYQTKKIQIQDTKPYQFKLQQQPAFDKKRRHSAETSSELISQQEKQSSDLNTKNNIITELPRNSANVDDTKHSITDKEVLKNQNNVKLVQRNVLRKDQVQTTDNHFSQDQPCETSKAFINSSTSNNSDQLLSIALQYDQANESSTVFKPENKKPNFETLYSQNINLYGQQPCVDESNENVLNLQQQKLISSSSSQTEKSIHLQQPFASPTNQLSEQLPITHASNQQSKDVLPIPNFISFNEVMETDLHISQKNLSASASGSTSSSGKSQVRSPELARKMGLVHPQQSNTGIEVITHLKNENVTKRILIDDTFNMIKADEKISASKRKMAIAINDVPPELIFSKPKMRRIVKEVSPNTPKTCKEEINRSPTYQQFMRNMEQIIEMLDDTESPNYDCDDVDENIECISSKLLITMSNDVAKLKAKQALDLIPKNKLTLLINYSMRNIYLAKNYSAGPEDEDEIVDDDVIDKILNAMEACLLICNIYSTVNDLKFLQEDNISLIIKFVQFQFRETIFPLYDPVYTVKSMKKSDNRKKTKSHHNHHRSLQIFYSKAVELMKVFVTLFEKCIFVDTIVLPLSTLAVEPFFVDNIETLQFVCLELVTTIFRKECYEKIRSSILGDILSSIDRLPSSKKNLRPYKLTNNGGNIQMVTALVLQLIQCSTLLPDTLCGSKDGGKSVIEQISSDITNSALLVDKHNNDVIVLKKYDVAISIGGNFLTTFLNKCKARSNETDFRPLFENFIHDLLATVNKPEWPASELLLSLLGTMLVRYVSDKSIEQSIRLVSLDYLGIVAARLRKDTVESRCKVNIIDSMIRSIKTEQEKEGEVTIENNIIELSIEEQRIQFLQNILIDFLAINAQEENLIWEYARHFYLAQWYRDIIYQRRRIKGDERAFALRKKYTKGKKCELSDTPHSDSSDEKECNKKNENQSGCDVIDHELNLEIFNSLNDRKQYLLHKIKPYTISTEHNHTSNHHIKTYIDYNNGHLIAQYLASKRPFSQSFDTYLKKIILVVNEPSIAVRTRAMKCLANIVEVDPLVLKRKDMQMGVNQKFLDAAISVREAAVDLVGKFVLSNEELIDQYYDMLSTRILDTGVSVRKRVIKILRDICIEYPDFKKIPEICVKMIRRVNDEEGIQKLVTEVFMKMWFTPCIKNDKRGIQRKINQIIDVVNTAHDTGTTWLEGLLNSIFQPKETMLRLETGIQEPVKKNTEPPPEIILACQQLADGLVDRLIELEDTDNSRMLGCITTLHLLAKVRPQLLVQHAITIEPYLNIKCHSSTAPKFICAVADILEKVVPLVNNASESFLATLEEHLMLLVVSRNQAEVTSCVSCLGALVNKITKNYKLIQDCFQKFYRVLELSRNQILSANNSIEGIYTPMFRRSLFTIGILMRYFDFKSKLNLGEMNGLSMSICDDVFNVLMFFCLCNNYEIRKQALIALGSFCVMNDDYLTRPELKQYYCDLLVSNSNESSIKIICMRNIWIYLTESELHMHNKEKEWEKQSKTEDLKEMNDISSGMASRIIQLYLEDILDCFLNRDDSVRLWAVKVVQIVLRQGLVHPVRMVPYLICLSTDFKMESAHRADALLKDIDKTYSGFVNMKVQFGLQLCFQLQEILQSNGRIKTDVIRGYAKKENDPTPSALNDFLYTLLRTTKPQRRALVQTVTKQFDDQKTSLRQMLYIADNLAYFPYVVQDEPLYLIHQIDLLISIAGTHLLATFKECIKPSENSGDILEDDDDEEDPQVLFKRLPENMIEIQKCITSAQACMLLLILKEHLKDMYAFTDGKISRYSPSEQKMYEKAVTRKNVPDFNPKSTIEFIKKQQGQNFPSTETIKRQLSEDEKLDLVMKYLDFKKLMLKLDPDDADSDANESHDKLKTNTSSHVETTPTSSLTYPTSCVSQIVNTSGETENTTLNTSLDENTRHMLSPLLSLSIQNKETSITPTSRLPKKFSSSTARLSGRKLNQRSKIKKCKVMSSDDDDFSNEEYT